MIVEMTVRFNVEVKETLTPGQIAKLFVMVPVEQIQIMTNHPRTGTVMVKATVREYETGYVEQIDGE